MFVTSAATLTCQKYYLELTTLDTLLAIDKYRRFSEADLAIATHVC